MTPAQRAKQAAAILERAAFGNAEPCDMERARRWLIEAAGLGWRDIDSAPNDAVLVTDGGYCFMACQNDGRWFTGWEGGTVHIRLDIEPTHWMPLPLAPWCLRWIA